MFKPRAYSDGRMACLRALRNILQAGNGNVGNPWISVCSSANTEACDLVEVEVRIRAEQDRRDARSGLRQAPRTDEGRVAARVSRRQTDGDRDGQTDLFLGVFGPSGSIWVCFLLFLHVFGPSGFLWVCFLLLFHVLGPSGSSWVCFLMRFRVWGPSGSV